MKNKNTKDAIISHAIILFGKYGYEAVSIRRIASSVGIQAGSIYNHFVSKEEILESIFDFYKEKMAQYVPTMEEMVNLAQTKTSREVLGR